MGAVYAGCFYVLMDTKQPASRLQQILGILDSDVIVTSEKYLEGSGEAGLQRNSSYGTEELAAEPEDPDCSEELSESRHWM